MMSIILEDGYNCDYIYSIIIALFHATHNINDILNGDAAPNITYIQEYIKNRLVYPIQKNLSIESATINKFRLFLHNCGWNKEIGKIIDKGRVDLFYSFLISNLLGYTLKITKFSTIDNKPYEQKYDMIKITDDYLFDVDNNIGKIVELTPMVNKWVADNLLKDSISFKFDEIPAILPIYLDIRDQNTGINKRYINVMESIKISNNGDKYQSMILWNIHSLICQNAQGDYYTIIFNHSDEMIGYMDKIVPSNWKIDSSDVSSAKKIMSEVRFVFYALNWG